MPEKDITEKILEDYNDVFADLVNVLLFNGKRLVQPEELEDIQVQSQYKADDDMIHELERDVMKKMAARQCRIWILWSGESDAGRKMDAISCYRI